MEPGESPLDDVRLVRFSDNRIADPRVARRTLM
jgi:hypothetical protein